MTSNTLKVGDFAPDFTLPSDMEGSVTLSTLRPAPVVLYFYPKDATPGCTTQAVDFTAIMDDFANLNAHVLGISKDSLKKHENFRAKHALRVNLLSDSETNVCEHYGTWGEKQNYGRSYMGITRTTFLIAPDGRIHKIWHKVRVKDHAADVLDALQNMMAP